MFIGISKEKRVHLVKNIVYKMPEENFLLLKTVISFLTEVFKILFNIC